MLIYELLFVLCIIFLSVYVILDNDIFAPAILFCMSFIFASICAAINIKVWKFSLNSRTLFVIILGVVSFCIGNIMVYFFYKRRCRKYIRNEKKCTIIEQKKIPKTNMYVMFLFGVFVFCVYYLEVRKIGGGGSFVSMMFNFSNATKFGGKSVSVITNMLTRFVTAISVLCIFCFMNNVYLKGQRIRHNIYILLPVIPDILRSILGGGRFRLLQIIIEPLMLYCFMYIKKYNKRIRFNLKFIVRGLGILVGSAMLFYGVKEIVGRSSDQDIVTYVSTYFGGSIQLLDLVIDKTKKYHTIFWGRNTFDSIYKYITKFFNVDFGSISNPGFLASKSGVLIGNVYTCFFSYICDFGMAGVCALSFLGGIIWSWFYYKACISVNVLWQIIYSYLGYGLLLQSFSEMTYTTFTSINIWAIIVCIIIMYNVFKRVKIKWIKS